LCNVLKEFRFGDGLGKVDYIADDVGLDINIKQGSGVSG
jgi:hypothetical protein